MSLSLSRSIYFFLSTYRKAHFHTHFEWARRFRRSPVISVVVDVVFCIWMPLWFHIWITFRRFCRRNCFNFSFFFVYVIFFLFGRLSSLFARILDIWLAGLYMIDWRFWLRVYSGRVNFEMRLNVNFFSPWSSIECFYTHTSHHQQDHKQHYGNSLVSVSHEWSFSVVG